MNLFDLNKNIIFNQSVVLKSDLPLQARAIRIINVFRFFLSLIFAAFYLYADKPGWTETQDTSFFLGLAISYLIFSASLLIVNPYKSKTLIFFHPVQIIIDIVFIVMMMYAAGGIQSGLGLLLIITIVTASLVSDGRFSIFYAAIASICLLLEQSYRIAKWDLELATYSQPVMLSLSCFATAWLGYSLAKRILQSEALALARGVDLENLEQINALITQEMHDGVIVVDQTHTIRHHNAQADLLLSLSINQGETASLNTKAPEILHALLQWARYTDADNNLTITVNHHILKLRLEPINHAHREMGAVIFIQDWSQIQSAAQQTKLAALGRLTANIAHEIRNPLSAISHANQLLQEEENNSASNVRMLQIIADNIQRIDQIIKDVLELNRRDRTQQESINLNQFILDFHAQFCAVEKIPPTHFKFSLFSEQQTVTFDQRHLMQIVWNLCKNGWEHSHKLAGSLRLNCVESGNAGLSLEITDDGHGVAEKDRSKLFEPFYTTKNTGNGLGLYISRELSEANNASLEYQALEQGSAFILQIKNI